MRIARDGTWLYHGSPIGRKALVKLFASVLRRDDDGRFWLVTPVERGVIDVDDAPFIAVEMAVDGRGRGQTLKFRTNLDDWVTAGADHPLRVEIDPESGEPSPYVHVRDRLEARLARPVFYHLVDVALATENGDAGHDNVLGVWSSGAYFELGRLAP